LNNSPFTGDYKSVRPCGFEDGRVLLVGINKITNILYYSMFDGADWSELLPVKDASGNAITVESRTQLSVLEMHRAGSSQIRITDGFSFNIASDNYGDSWSSF